MTTRLSPRVARLALTLGGAALLAACSHASGPELIPDQPVRLAGAESGVKYGDCVTARQHAADKPDLEVDRLPTPRSFSPPPLPVNSMPPEVRSAKYNEVKVTVLVDTLGRADMRTFTVVKTTHPWLAASAKGAIAKWKFEPARLAGCKVPRVYKWGATSGKA
jgi:hypothetical protein